MNKPKSALRGAGFYIVLLLCLAIVGVSGYMILFGTNTVDSPVTEPDATVAASESTLPASASESDGSNVEDVVSPESIPAGDSESVVEMPEEPVEDSTPVVAEAPSLVVWPLRGEILTAFSMDSLIYDETMGDWRTHDGLDIAAAAGTQVLAASAGTVVSVSDDALMGTTVVLKHSGGYQTTYANLQSKPTVSKGDSVSAGQVIGAVGTTAIAESAMGPHLHFAVSKDGDAIDPEQYLGSQ